MKHTPPPWHLRTRGGAVDDSKGLGVANVWLTDPDTRKRKPEFEANARLIEAAPEMYDILVDLQEGRITAREAADVHFAPLRKRIDGEGK